ncbi:hypothetical protein P5V15_015370 [Pogonomyrmex californicus]
MKVKVGPGCRPREDGPSRRGSALRGVSFSSREEAHPERTRWDPKDGELCWSGRVRETLMEVRSDSDVPIVGTGYRGERLIEPSSSWFPPKFPSG